MQNRNNQRGFTLLEIIIVAIIIAVLASLALPRFLETVQNTYQSEAWQSISATRGAIHRCNTLKNTYTACSLYTSLDIRDPGIEPNAHFAYGLVNTATNFSITATRNTLDGGTNTNWVRLVQDDPASTVVRSGNTIWSGI